MRLRRRIFGRLRIKGRANLFVWATLFGIVCGVLGALEPVEDTLSMTRGLLRNRPSDGQTVVIAIDDKSLVAQGRWPWSRAVSANIIDKLNTLGAKSIYFDFSFKGHSDSKDDAIFVDALKRSRAPVMLAAVYELDPITHRHNSTVSGLQTPYSESVFIASQYNYAGEIRRMPLGAVAEGKLYSTMSSHLAGLAPQPKGSFPIDLSIDPSTIPTFSAVDLFNGRVPAASLKGKSVVVAPTSLVLFDIKQYPGRGPLPGAYFLITGSQTLREGRPIEFGWLPALAIALGSALLVFRRAPNKSLQLLGIAGCVILLAPFAWEPLRLSGQIAPALASITVFIANGLWRKAKRAGGLVNTSSGLPNLSALNERPLQPHHILIVARISNYSDIVSSLRPDLQAAMLGQIVGRLSVGVGGETLYQGEAGVFAWMKSMAMASTLGDELDGLHAVLSVPIKIAERSIDLQLNFGIERDGSRSLSNRVGSALLAAEAAQAEGVHWQDFDTNSLATAEWRLSMLGQIEDAIEAKQLWVAFQPQLDLRTGRIEGAEALVRWNHPVRGEIAPDDFVLHAERTGRIDRLTAFVVAEAARAAAALHARGINFGISINISASLLDTAYLHDLIVPQVDRENLPHNCVTLEITESAEFKQGSVRADKLERLRKQGFRISIDDYGTGYSTLEYLKRIKADEIKIDKSFIGDLDADSGDRAMVESTIDLAHALGRRVVAEGVETHATLAMLRNMGCDMAQGYLIGRPMSFQKLLAVMTSTQSRRLG